MDIYTKLVYSGDDVYYKDDFRQVVEDHLYVIRNDRKYTVESIEPMRAYKYAHDFYGLLQDLKVPMQYHWASLRLNGLTSPEDYDGHSGTIMIVDPDVIEQLLATHETQLEMRN